MEMDSLQEALNLFKQAVQLDLQMDDFYQVGNQYSNMGLCFSSMKKYDSALYYHDKALQIFNEINVYDNMSSSRTYLGMTYFDLKNYKQAIIQGNEALELSQKIGSIIEIKIASELLYKSYKK